MNTEFKYNDEIRQKRLKSFPDMDIFKACANGHWPIVENLLKLGVDPNSRCCGEDKYKQRIMLIENRLIENEIGINKKECDNFLKYNDKNGNVLYDFEFVENKIIHKIYKNGSLRSVEYSVNSKTYETYETCETCLTLASGNCNFLTVKILLDYGADVNLKMNGLTPLENAKNRAILFPNSKAMELTIKLLEEKKNN